MKHKLAQRLVVIATMFIPVTVMAQEKDSLLAQTLSSSLQQRPAVQTGRERLPSTGRPRIEGSMVGYLENAIVGSQVRIRFDAGFHTQFPDRAEFFYAKCGCYRDLKGSGLPAYDPTTPGPRPGVATDLRFQQLYFEGEYAPNQRFSVFTEVPVRWLQPKAFVPGTGTFSNQAGLGDIRAGVKAGIIASEDSYLTVQVRGYFPSGDASRGLGTDHASIEPALLFYRKLAPRVAIESQISDWHPFKGSAGVATATNSNPESFSGDVLSYGVGPSFELYRSDRVRFAPVVELVGWRVLSGSQTIWATADTVGMDAGGTNIVNLKVGARTGIGANSSIYVGYGRGLTDAVWYKDLVRVEYRYAF